MLCPSSLLLPPIARHPRHNTPNRASHTILNPMPVVAQLPVRLLRLALGVLLRAFALQAVGADHVAEGLFGAADGLVPGAGRAVGVVGGDAALGGYGDRAKFTNGVGGVALGVGLGFGCVGLGLLGRGGVG